MTCCRSPQSDGDAQAMCSEILRVLKQVREEGAGVLAGLGARGMPYDVNGQARSVGRRFATDASVERQRVDVLLQLLAHSPSAASNASRRSGASSPACVPGSVLRSSVCQDARNGRTPSLRMRIASGPSASGLSPTSGPASRRTSRVVAKSECSDSSASFTDPAPGSSGYAVTRVENSTYNCHAARASASETSTWTPPRPKGRLSESERSFRATR